MSCRETQSLLHAYVDGELALSESLEVEHHLDECVDCRQLHKNALTLRASLRAPSLYHQAPRPLVARIHASLPRKSQRLPWLFWGLSGASTAVVAICLVLFLPTLKSPTREVTLEKEAVACHIRSLLMNHPTEVTSTDQHTVKPWFKGKLDFAPVVTDLREQGFPLLGGRLD